MNTVPSGNTWRLAGPSVAALLLLTFSMFHETLLYLIRSLEPAGNRGVCTRLPGARDQCLPDPASPAGIGRPDALPEFLGIAGGAGGKRVVDAGDSRRCPDAAGRWPVAGSAGGGLDGARQPGDPGAVVSDPVCRFCDPRLVSAVAPAAGSDRRCRLWGDPSAGGPGVARGKRDCAAGRQPVHRGGLQRHALSAGSPDARHAVCLPEL